jgi:hypothetical protein
MKTITCDGCGTTDNVKEAFLTAWNGNVFDLCRACSDPLIKILDSVVGGKHWSRNPGRTHV